MSDDTAQLFLGKIIPVSPMASRGVSEKTSFAQSVSLSPFRQDEERAFVGGEAEIICRCILTFSSENFRKSEFGMTCISLQKYDPSTHPSPADGSAVRSVVTDDVEMTLLGFSAWG